MNGRVTVRLQKGKLAGGGLVGSFRPIRASLPSADATSATEFLSPPWGSVIGKAHACVDNPRRTV